MTSSETSNESEAKDENLQTEAKDESVKTDVQTEAKDEDVKAEVQTEAKDEDAKAEAEADPPKAGPARHILAVVGEWFWCAKRMRAAKDSRVFSAEDRTCAAQARAACNLAEGVAAQYRESEAEARPDRTATCLAYGLYREATLWGLRVHALNAKGDMESVFQGAPRPLLAECAGGQESLLSIERALVANTTTEFAFHDEPSQKSELEAAARFATRLSATLDDRSARVAKARIQRWTRTVIFTAVLLAGVFFGVRRVLRPTNLAAHVPWRASSAYAGCPLSGTGFAEVGTLGQAFFSTLEEEEPWIDFDLGKPRWISSLLIVNRGDCCKERAVPLIVETSMDDKTFKEVAKNPTSFVDWAPVFAPTEARYVRLRVPRKTYLHLQSVEIH